MANPRAIVAMMRQCNTVDLTRRSPSYEVRLAKYSGRAFEVYVPTLKREEIDPTVSFFFFFFHLPSSGNTEIINSFSPIYISVNSCSVIVSSIP
jgi:hypothetical protein